MSWSRKDHNARVMQAAPALIHFEPSTVVLGRPHVDEQDASRVARSRMCAGAFEQREVRAALDYADVALEPKESILDRATRYLADLMASL